MAGFKVGDKVVRTSLGGRGQKATVIQVKEKVTYVKVALDGSEVWWHNIHFKLDAIPEYIPPAKYVPKIGDNIVHKDGRKCRGCVYKVSDKYVYFHEHTIGNSCNWIIGNARLDLEYKPAPALPVKVGDKVTHTAHKHGKLVGVIISEAVSIDGERWGMKYDSGKTGTWLKKYTIHYDVAKDVTLTGSPKAYAEDKAYNILTMNPREHEIFTDMLAEPEIMDTLCAWWSSDETTIDNGLAAMLRRYQPIWKKCNLSTRLTLIYTHIMLREDRGDRLHSSLIDKWIDVGSETPKDEVVLGEANRYSDHITKPEKGIPSEGWEEPPNTVETTKPEDYLRQFETKSEEDKPMKLLIQDKVTINGADASNMDDDTIIDLIRDAEKQIEEYKSIKAQSNAITALITQLEAGVKRLVAILDKE